MLSVHVLIHVVSAVIISVLLHCQISTYIQRGHMLTDDNRSDVSTKGNFSSSSVWCPRDQPCQLKNVCYKPDTQEFLVFTGSNSILDLPENLPSSFTLDLSSVRQHNALVANVVLLPQKLYSKFTTTWRTETTLVFKRFLPGNLMHMFHDDILPLHHTLQLISLGRISNSSSPYNVQLLLMEEDTDPDPELDSMYQQFSRHSLKFIPQENVTSHLQCYEDLYIGLSKSTTWYDFGFEKPQGPLADLKVTATNVHSTVNYIYNNLHQRITDLSDYVVLVTRKENRKILNELDLTLAFVKELGLKVVTLSHEMYGLEEMILWTRNSKGIIGMHGSLLILSIFLKPGSFLIELFPFAVNPANYTPYKTLSDLRGMGIFYRSWVNMDQRKSICYPERPPEVGGLSHLSEEEREIIVSQTEVPPHLCCSNPSWLYHIYQDTEVNTAEVTALIKSILLNGANIPPLTNLEHVYPNKVSYVNCLKYITLDSSYDDKSAGQYQSYLNLNLKWEPPWVVAFVEGQKHVEYELLIQDIDSSDVKSFATVSTSLTISVDKDGLYYIWIRCVLNGNAGPYSDSTLCEDQ